MPDQRNKVLDVGVNTATIAGSIATSTRSYHCKPFLASLPSFPK